MSDDTKDRVFHCFAKLQDESRTYATILVPFDDDAAFADEVAFKERLAVFFGTLWNQEVLVLEDNEMLELRKGVFCAEIERRLAAKKSAQ